MSPFRVKCQPLVRAGKPGVSPVLHLKGINRGSIPKEMNAL